MATSDDRTRLMRIRRAAFGSRLRQLRASRGMTQETVARRAQMDRSFYSQLESGTHSMAIDRLWDLAAALDVPVADLFREPP